MSSHVRDLSSFQVKLQIDQRILLFFHLQKWSLILLPHTKSFIIFDQWPSLVKRIAGKCHFKNCPSDGKSVYFFIFRPVWYFCGAIFVTNPHILNSGQIMSSFDFLEVYLFCSTTLECGYKANWALIWESQALCLSLKLSSKHFCKCIMMLYDSC